MNEQLTRRRFIRDLALLVGGAVTASGCASPYLTGLLGRKDVSLDNFSGADFNASSVVTDLDDAGLRVWGEIGKQVVANPDGSPIKGEVFPYWTLRTDELIETVQPKKDDKPGRMSYNRADNKVRVLVHRDLSFPKAERSPRLLISPRGYVQNIITNSNGLMELVEPEFNIPTIDIGNQEGLVWGTYVPQGGKRTLAIVTDPRFQFHALGKTRNKNGLEVSRGKILYQGQVFVEQEAILAPAPIAVITPNPAPVVLSRVTPVYDTNATPDILRALNAPAGVGPLRFEDTYSPTTSANNLNITEPVHQ